MQAVRWLPWISKQWVSSTGHANFCCYEAAFPRVQNPLPRRENCQTWLKRIKANFSIGNNNAKKKVNFANWAIVFNGLQTNLYFYWFLHYFLKYWLLLILERDRWKEERNLNLFDLFTYSLANSCMCHASESNPQPWCVARMFWPDELPGQGCITLKQKFLYFLK